MAASKCLTKEDIKQRGMEVHQRCIGVLDRKLNKFSMQAPYVSGPGPSHLNHSTAEIHRFLCLCYGLVNSLSRACLKHSM